MSAAPEVRFQLFTKDQVDAQFNEAIALCEGLSCPAEIIKLFEAKTYNQLLLTLNLDGTLPCLHVYRVTIPWDDFNEEDSSSFSYNPNPPLGRANLSGKPVFYCSFNTATAMREMKEGLKEGQELYISEWKISFEQPVFAHTLMINSNTQNKKIFASDLVQNQLLQAEEWFASQEEKYREGGKQFLLRLGDMFTMRDSKHYNITSAYASKALSIAPSDKGFGVAMLMYPSVVNNHEGINYAIHPRLVDSPQMKLTQVFKMRVSSIIGDTISTATLKRGVQDHRGILEWKRPALTIKEVLFNHVKVWTYSGKFFSGDQALKLRMSGEGHVFHDYLQQAVNRNEVAKFISTLPYEDDIFEHEAIEKINDITFYTDHVCAEGQTCNCTCHFTIPVKCWHGYS